MNQIWLPRFIQKFDWIAKIFYKKLKSLLSIISYLFVMLIEQGIAKKSDQNKFNILFEPSIVDLFTKSRIFGVIYKIGLKSLQIIAFFELTSKVISFFFPDYEYCFSWFFVPLPPLPSHSTRNRLRVDLRLANSQMLFFQLFLRFS